MQTCSKCGAEKPPEDFRKGLKTCRKCYTERNSQRKREQKLKAVDYLGGICHRCGGFFPSYVYDFHHIDPTEKEYTPSELMHAGWDKITEELDKCLLLCANCHRMEHYGQETETK